MSGGRGDPLGAFATSGIVPGPHLDFVQFWDLRANLLGLCCVRCGQCRSSTSNTGNGESLKGYRTLRRCRTGLVVPPDSNQGSFSIPLQRLFEEFAFRDTPPNKCYSDSGLGLKCYSASQMLLGLRTRTLDSDSGPNNATTPEE